MTVPTQLLSQQAVDLVSDLVPDLRTLARCAVMKKGKGSEDVEMGGMGEMDVAEGDGDVKLAKTVDDALDVMLSEEEKEGIWEFWKTEWVVQ